VKIIKNITTGFLISFVGAIPLGYLNFVGLTIYSSQGLLNFLFFLLGVVSIEMIIVALTLRGTLWLLSKKKLVIILEALSVALLLVFAGIYSFQNESITGSQFTIALNNSLHPFILGLLLSAANFFQIPFWAGWNLVLAESKRMAVEKALKYYYVCGTALGTIAGVTIFVIGFRYITNKTITGQQLVNSLIPLIFVLMALFQLYKLSKKYNLFKIHSTPINVYINKTT